MSVAGFKKQIYKASQMMSEKVGGAEGTKLDEDFLELKRKSDTTSKAVEEVVQKTIEVIQPNPTIRTKLALTRATSQGQSNSHRYPQPEGSLGECMTKHGWELGKESNFGGALIDVGDTMMRMAEIKDSLDMSVKQNFLEPMQTVVEKDIKDIQHHLKKLDGRRLEYDYKKKRPGKIQDEEIRTALEKFHESKELAEGCMHNLLETDVEQVSQLSGLVGAFLDYHREAVQILDGLTDKLRQRVIDSQNRPRQAYTPKPRPAFDFSDAPAASSPPAYSPSFQHAAQPSCKALYDFEPENEGELAFREGDFIQLRSRIDDNWLEGSLNGRTGLFPENYVEVIVPL